MDMVATLRRKEGEAIVAARCVKRGNNSIIGIAVVLIDDDERERVALLCCLEMNVIEVSSIYMSEAIHAHRYSS